MKAYEIKPNNSLSVYCYIELYFFYIQTYKHLNSDIFNLDSTITTIYTEVC